MADYTTLLDGMMAAAQTTSAPEVLMQSLLSPAVPCDGVRARKAPLGLRRLEAALLSGGFSADEVAVVPPEKLEDAVGPDTRVVLVSSGDPLGLGMNTTTMAAITGGRPYTGVWLGRMIGRLAALKARHPQLKVVLGGPGAWQAALDGKPLARRGVDVVFCGYAERDLPGLVHDLRAGNKVKPILTGSGVGGEAVPGIVAPTSMGVVEISRGCGLGCRFCTLRSEPMIHIPVRTILRDVRTNVRAGVTSVALVSEDFFRYGSERGEVRPRRLIEMLRAVRSVRSLKLIQPDHVSVSSVARFPEERLREVRDIITAGVRHDYVWVNLGVETADGELLRANACAGKMRPFRPEEWADASETAVRRLIAAGFIPMVSLIFGLPGETEEHIRRTLDFVERLRGQRMMIFPLFFAPVSPRDRAFTLEDMSPLHWKLFRLCYRFNFKWFPRTYWDNQSGAGIPLLKRLLLQAAGRMNILDWKLRFVRKSGRLFA